VGEEANEGTRHVDISDELAAKLVRDQFPDLSDLDIGRRYVFEDHIAIRLGDHLCLNFPTVPGLGEAMESSAEWLRLVVDDWSFPASISVRLGKPQPEYPFIWQVSNWIAGSNAAILPLSREAAAPLGQALRQVHSPAPSWAPTSPEGGTPLPRFRKSWHDLISQLHDTVGPLGSRIDPTSLMPRWEQAVDSVIDIQPCWIHGNLDPRYVVSDQGGFAGIGSWWTFGSGDPASDIAAAFLLIPRQAESLFLEAYGRVSRATRERIAGYWLLRALRYAVSPNPFLWRLGWVRLEELITLGDLD
jgi:aminoglycoside phosphotransferase (APT) family kinase protein